MRKKTRKKQAETTYKKIQTAARKLVKAKPAQNVSIKDICKEANVGVGTFYHYFSSKDEALYDISGEIDEYFEDAYLNYKFNGATPVERLYDFFIIQADFMIQYELNNYKQKTKTSYLQIYSNLFSQNRLTNQILVDILREDTLLFRKLKEQYSVEETAEYLLTLTRGIVVHWLVDRHSFDLKKSILKCIDMTLIQMNDEYIHK
ncbi:MAG: TetR/AcrR family transcriptional regulator [Clostridia bacterium]|nr:TetR/AcrR family transcriptional regulator [Clostridia bacterium]